MRNTDNIVDKVYSVMDKEGLALIKLDVAYALVGMTPKSIRKIFQLKRRSRERLCVVLGNSKVFKEIINPELHHYIDGFTYPVGLLGKVNKKSDYFQLIPEEIIHNDRIAVFINMGELGDELASYAYSKGRLVFGSSANITDAGNHYKLNDVESEIRKGVDFEVDLGSTKYQELRPDGRGYSSAMIDLDNDIMFRRGLVCDRVVEQARKMGLKIPNY